MYSLSAPKRLRDISSSKTSFSKHGPSVTRRRLGPDDSAINVTKVSTILEHRGGPVIVSFKAGEHDGLLATRQPVCGELFWGASCKCGSKENCECKKFRDHLENLFQRLNNDLGGRLTLSWGKEWRWTDWILFMQKCCIAC